MIRRKNTNATIKGVEQSRIALVVTNQETEVLLTKPGYRQPWSIPIGYINLSQYIVSEGLNRNSLPQVYHLFSDVLGSKSVDAISEITPFREIPVRRENVQLIVFIVNLLRVIEPETQHQWWNITHSLCPVNLHPYAAAAIVEFGKSLGLTK